MKVLLLAGAYAPNRLDGAAVAAEQTAGALRDRGHTVVVVTAMPGSLGSLQRWSVDGISVVGVAVTPPGSRDRHPPASVGDALRRIVRAVAPEVIQVESWRLFGEGVAAGLADAPTPVLLRIGGSGPPASSNLVQVSDLLLASDPQHAALPDVPADRVRIVPPGVARPATGWRRPARMGPMRLGYLGGRDDQQGYQVLLDALTELRRTDYALHAVDPAAARGVRSLREWDFRVPGLVRLVPAFHPGARDAFYAGIDVLLHLPQAAGSPALSVAEAQLRGVWPITSAFGAAAARIGSRVDGEAIPAGSAATTCEALAWVLDNPAAVTGMPAPNAVPTIGESADALEQVFRELTD